MMNVKSGMSTRFWLDKWCSNVPFRLLFSQLFVDAQDPSGSVLSHMSGNGWDLKLPYLFQDGLID